jgi:hypothetical protein
MSKPGQILGVYLHLARASALRQRPHARDRFLILAGALAASLQLARIADHCRREVLAHNPHHLIRRWNTLAEALEDQDFVVFWRQLQRRYPLEKAERMLAELGIDVAREHATYYNDDEYAAALLGLPPL